MTKWNRNGEGYADRTAGIAIQRVSREERKNDMTKKRSCRRTTDESIIHDKAVKMRKMTDAQLVHYVEDRVEKARSEGFNKGKERVSRHQRPNVKEILEEIDSVKGIGESKLSVIRTILERHLEVNIDA